MCGDCRSEIWILKSNVEFWKSVQDIFAQWWLMDDFIDDFVDDNDKQQLIKKNIHKNDINQGHQPAGFWGGEGVGAKHGVCDHSW